eukprot:TRINITY_DN13944_c0_g1_i3.p1 TRINITY_DN13944_c0_g1~~TRINITY_DN13944_c0_g1_i3.p1  ORF type:complete len:191 (-),score=23.66 TRINITY_DN13944_c0_g1_i3:410-982(-)
MDGQAETAVASFMEFLNTKNRVINLPSAIAELIHHVAAVDVQTVALDLQTLPESTTVYEALFNMHKQKLPTVGIVTHTGLNASVSASALLSFLVSQLPIAFNLQNVSQHFLASGAVPLYTLPPNLLKDIFFCEPQMTLKEGLAHLSTNPLLVLNNSTRGFDETGVVLYGFSHFMLGIYTTLYSGGCCQQF